ncbi:hypothetical protein NPIL_383591 [Nephila pilipes]|uniref:Uncharacterized protein n=1 Tax=Nephila pilipes TaxID=299642 RepID=A0A8X6NZP0_NEPPI|nr:hypothetical protein NPIL_383591 [Nephila pilipes]
MWENQWIIVKNKLGLRRSGKKKVLPTLIFPDENVKNEIGQNLQSLIEQARFKHSSLKQEEIKNELAQFNNLCQSWGISTPYITQIRSRISDNSRKFKINKSICSNRFSSFIVEDPLGDIQIDDPTAPTPTQNKPPSSQANKKKNNFVKKTAETNKPVPLQKPDVEPNTSCNSQLSSGSTAALLIAKSTSVPPLPLQKIMLQIRLHY